MANLNIRTSECAWAQLEVKILGRTIKGLLEIEVKKTSEKEHLYGSGKQPIDIQDGNVSYTGTIKVLGFEQKALNNVARTAGFADITEVPHESIVISAKFKKSAIDVPEYWVCGGVAFTETGFQMAQNDKKREITLPFLAMNCEPIL